MWLLHALPLQFVSVFLNAFFFSPLSLIRSKLILVFPCCTSFSFLSTDAVGVPLYLFVELNKHREHFYAKKDGTYSDKHDWAYARLGGMFTQYEPQFWFWEIGNLIFKLCITGVLCIVAQGSAFQVILALVFCMINANLLLRFAPYDSETSDTLSIICAVCLTMTVLGGFVLMANETMETVNPVFMDYGLIALNVVPLVLFVVHVVRFETVVRNERIRRVWPWCRSTTKGRGVI